MTKALRATNFLGATNFGLCQQLIRFHQKECIKCLLKKTQRAISLVQTIAQFLVKIKSCAPIDWDVLK